LFDEYEGKLVKVIFLEDDRKKAVVGYILDVINDKLKILDRHDRYHMIDMLVVRRISEFVKGTGS
jgi:hypothetical protein